MSDKKKGSHFLTKEQKTEIVEQYIAETSTIAHMARQYGVAPNTISGILSRRGINSSNRHEHRAQSIVQEDYYDSVDVYCKAHKLSKEQIYDIIDEYTNSGYEVNCATLASEYGVTTPAIRKLLMKHKVEIRDDHSQLQRKFDVDETFFDVIDTEDKAYCLGLLYADGCNHIDTNTMAISLQEGDRDILDKFQYVIKSNNPPKFRDMSHRKNRQNQYALYVTNKHISEQLTLKGCTTRKSLTLEFPPEEIVPTYLHRHFIRGYFDGDGCICYYDSTSKYRTGRVRTDTRVEFNVTSTRNFLLGTKIVIERELNMTIGQPKPKKSNKNGHITQQLMTLDRKAFLVMEWLYDQATIYMQRKYDKYQACKQLAAWELVSYRYSRRPNRAA